MSKAILIALFFVSLLTSCGGDEPKHHNPKDPSGEISSSLHVTVQSTTASYLGDKLSIQIDASKSWATSCSENWCHVSPSHGNGGKADVAYVTIGANTTEQQRNATIIVKSGILQSAITLRQNAKPAITLSTNQITLNNGSSDATLVLKTNTKWKAACNASWITFTPSAGSKGTTAISISASKNATNEQREATLTIYADDITAEVRILQTAL